MRHIGRMNAQYDILIVGGGLNGPALALALAQGGAKVAVIDARAPQTRASAGFDGRAYAIAAASQRLLAAIGVWPALVGHAQPMLQIKTTDGVVGRGPAPFFMTFDHAELGAGPMGYMVEDRHVYAGFLAAMQGQENITLTSGHSVAAQDVQAGCATVTLQDGQVLTAKLIVGADGRTSGVAQRAGITRWGWDYGQTALVTAIHHERAHNGIAHQYFLPSGPLAILPLAGGHHSSIVWSEKSAIAAQIQALDDAGYLAALRPRFGDFLGEIALAGARFTYPLNLTVAKNFIAPRVALIGDAAHGVHPIAGQGLNLGLRDVAALAEVLIEGARLGLDIGAPSVLARYEQWRRFDTTIMALGMDGVNKLFSNDNPILRGLRDLGMGAIAAAPSLRRAFIGKAAGVAGEGLPRLLRGERV
jgi:2-octaprenyl-6-methoxyphenol hydroxylase